MYRLVTNQEISLAENSMRALRSAVSGANHNSVGPAAREQIRVLSAQVNSASVAIDVLRNDIHNPRVKALVTEYDRIEKTAREIVDDLGVAAQYQGERRSAMTVKQKSDFISKNGAEQFFQLPR